MREADVGTGVEWSRRGVQLEEVRGMSKSGGGDGVETGTCTYGEFELWLQPAELTDYIGVMCTLGGAQATEQAAQLGLLLMCRLRSEEFQPTDFNKSPPDMGPSDISPPVQLISGQMPTRLGVLDQ